MKTLRILFLLMFFVVPSFAQLTGNPENWCRNGAFPRESSTFRLATITAAPGENVYFHEDTRDDCPQEKSCRTKSYLVPNDEIIVSRTYGNWACAWYQPAKGAEIVGWLALEKVSFKEANANPEASGWLGHWRHYDNVIKINKSKNDGFFEITGDAIWRGLGDNVHVGDLDNRAKPNGTELKISDGEEEFSCRVTMHLIGKYLIVADNLNCGGLNVSFSGVYRKK